MLVLTKWEISGKKVGKQREITATPARKKREITEKSAPEEDSLLYLL